jgi:hypothetical protein
MPAASTPSHTLVSARTSPRRSANTLGHPFAARGSTKPLSPLAPGGQALPPEADRDAWTDVSVIGATVSATSWLCWATHFPRGDRPTIGVHLHQLNVRICLP